MHKDLRDSGADSEGFEIELADETILEKAVCAPHDIDLSVTQQSATSNNPCDWCETIEERIATLKQRRERDFKVKGKKN